jgi:outer membrane protein TolC
VKKILCLIFIGFLAKTLVGKKDSTQLLTLDAFIDIVRLHHPVAKQANLVIDMGDAQVRKSRGAFDPYAFVGFSEKFFDGKSYYRLADGGLKIPTWFGVEIKTGFERNTGTQLNPEALVPDAGLFYAGASINLGNGLLMDERRAALRSAQIYQQSTELERRIIYNQLIYEAGLAYWDWFRTYNNYLVMQEGVRLINIRLNAIKQSALLGDRPFIDTLEGTIQLQMRQVRLQQSELEFKNSTAQLGVFLWIDAKVPLELSESTIPFLKDSITSTSVKPEILYALDTLQLSHPILRQYQFKLEGQRIERRLKVEQLKPNLNLQYIPLSEPINGNPLGGLSLNNYKWGFNFTMPIFLRKARGSLALTDIKIKQTLLDLNNKNAQIQYKALASMNTWDYTNRQAVLYQQTVQDYSRLFQGELTKFRAGESSVFLVNKREVGYLEAQLKYIELLAKNHKAELAANYALGLLN